MTGRASPGAPTAPSSGTSAKARICEFFGIITTTRKKNNQRIKVQSTLFFFFSSLNRSACAQGIPCKQPRGIQAGEWRGAASHCLWGPRGLLASLDWVPSCSAATALCLCMGRTTFQSGLAGRRWRWHPSRWAAQAPPSAPPTRLYTQYIHTHTGLRGERACHCFTLNRKAV